MADDQRARIARTGVIHRRLDARHVDAGLGRRYLGLRRPGSQRHHDTRLLQRWGVAAGDQDESLPAPLGPDHDHRAGGHH